MKKENILLVAYKFCPRGRIGTRRWSKFAKLLSKNYRVHIVCGEYPSKDKVNWCADVENNPDIIIHTITASFPVFTIAEPRSTIDRVIFRLLSETFYYQDEAQYWKKPLMRKSRHLIDQYKIKKVIATGSPFSVLHHLIPLKKENDNLRLILDLRDPWMQIVPKNYGFILPKYKRQKEMKMEKEAIEIADQVFVVSKQMQDSYSKAYPKFSNKFSTVYNGYDTEDFNYSEISMVSIGKLLIAYAGALHLLRAEGLNYMLRSMYDNNSEWWIKNVEVHIYSNQITKIHQDDKEFLHFCSKIVKPFDPLPQKELFQQLKCYDVLLTINDKNNGFAFGTKFFEYVALNKPILLLSPQGEQYHLLNENDQFVSDYNKEECRKMLERLREKYINNQLKPAKDLLEQFDLNNIMVKLIQKLEEK